MQHRFICENLCDRTHPKNYNNTVICTIPSLQDDWYINLAGNSLWMREKLQVNLRIKLISEKKLG
jgi:hypothetical protein